MEDQASLPNQPVSSRRKPHQARGSRPGPRGSNKPLDVRAAVVARYAQGETKSGIARTCGIDRGTVARILSSAEIQQTVDAVRSDIVHSGDVWLARENLHERLKKGSEVMTLATLRGFNVLRTSPEIAVNNINVHALGYAELKAAESAKKTENLDSPAEGKDGVLHNHS